MFNNPESKKAAGSWTLRLKFDQLKYSLVETLRIVRTNTRTGQPKAYRLIYTMLKHFSVHF